MESKPNKNPALFRGIFFIFNIVMFVQHIWFISLISDQIIHHTPEPLSMSSDLFGKVLFARVTCVGQVLLSIIMWVSILIINKLKGQSKISLPKTTFWLILSPILTLGILLFCEIFYPLQFHMEM